MDADIRELERRVAAGDPSAAASLDRELARRGLGWEGEELPPGVQRGPAAPFYEASGVRLARARGVLVPIVDCPRDLHPLESDRGTLVAAVERACGVAGTPRCVLDLSRTRGVYEAGLGEMVTNQLLRRNAGGALVLASARGQVRIIIEMLGLELAQAPDLASALELVLDLPAAPSGDPVWLDSATDLHRSRSGRLLPVVRATHHVVLREQGEVALALRSARHAAAGGPIVYDMSGTTYLGTWGLQELAREDDLALVGVQGQPRHDLDLVLGPTFFRRFDTVEQAVAEL